MSFYSRYEPKTFADLVFDNPKVANAIRYYSTGKKTKHLLLYGPPGSGKSAAARIIVDSCVPNLANTNYNDPLNLTTLEKEGLKYVERTWNAQCLWQSRRGYVIIDEVDKLKLEILNQLHTAAEFHTVGTFICTTNHAHKLDHALLNRFSKIEMNLPSPEAWLPRAKAIMACEGFDLADDQLRTLLGNKGMSARDMLEMLEEAILELNEMAVSSPEFTNQPRPKHS